MIEIQTCPHCSTRIVPSADGTCPSCRHGINDTLTPDQARELNSGVRRDLHEREAFAPPSEADRFKHVAKIGIGVLALAYAAIATIRFLDAIAKFAGHPNSYTGSFLAASVAPIAVGLAVAFVCLRGTNLVRKPIRFVFKIVILVLVAYVVHDYFTSPLLFGRVAIRGALTIDVPFGTRHRIGQGIDSAVGTVKLGGIGYTMNYDIGGMAGNYATNEMHKPFVWQKHDTIEGVKMDYSLRSQRGRQRLYVSFPELGPANFYTEIRDSSDIDAILDVMRTARPIERH